MCLFGREGVGRCVSTVIMLTSTQCVCLRVILSVSCRVYFCQFVRVSNVYKTLGVGVCSCVYPARPEIVTELRKQFTVNKPFPCSNKGPMRLNSVPLWTTSSSHEKTEAPANQSTLQHFFILSLSLHPSGALPTTARSFQLVLVHECVEKCSSLGGRGETICPEMSHSWSAS